MRQKCGWTGVLSGRQRGGGGGRWLMKSPYRARVAGGRGGASNSAPCTARAGSSHSCSPLPTCTGCAASAVEGRALSRS